MATLLTIGKVLCNKQERTLPVLQKIFIRLAGIQIVISKFLKFYVLLTILEQKVIGYRNNLFVVFFPSNLWSLVLSCSRHCVNSDWNFGNCSWIKI